MDLVEIVRIEQVLARHEARFLERVFTPREQAHSQGRRARTLHLAARFAAKEAAMKALGTGLASGISWQDVEIVNHANGAPHLVLHRAALSQAQGLGATGWRVSLTHTESVAGAVVVLWA